MAEKEGGIVKKGHEEGTKMAIALLKEFGLPLGLLPLENITEVGFVRTTGYMWIIQEKKVEHNFKIVSKLVSYDTEIQGVDLVNNRKPVLCVLVLNLVEALLLILESHLKVPTSIPTSTYAVFLAELKYFWNTSSVDAQQIVRCRDAGRGNAKLHSLYLVVVFLNSGPVMNADLVEIAFM
ncbi:hypothetical protein IFM89_008646 [Coptis chinensis]|uniref:Uncharacterized protein n=1 Tax=Coptis chinensis TaxID=261450 RepID=A0A835LLN0_9MAGN|nr:hypothetical protein IFM89_008646 [Coptis chinensis]